MEIEFTSPLPNGAELPTHPATTTARCITKYLKAFDAVDGTQLRAGIHRNELAELMNHNQMSLQHLYLYAIINGRIYHTRAAVIIEVATEDVVD